MWTQPESRPLGHCADCRIPYGLSLTVLICKMGAAEIPGALCLTWGWGWSGMVYEKGFYWQ